MFKSLNLTGIFQNIFRTFKQRQEIKITEDLFHNTRERHVLNTPKEEIDELRFKGNIILITSTKEHLAVIAVIRLLVLVTQVGCTHQLYHCVRRCLRFPHRKKNALFMLQQQSDKTRKQRRPAE